MSNALGGSSFWQDGNGTLKENIFPASPFVIETWNEVELHVKLNDPGQANGTLRYWLNGEAIIEKADINFRNTNTKGFNYFALMTNYAAYAFGCPNRRHDWYNDDVAVLSAPPPGAFGGT